MDATKGKIKKNLGIGAIIASCFFLFNPDIAIIDFIPDVFGYLLLIAGLSQFAELNEKIAEARIGFQKAAICNAVKLGLIVVLFGLVTPREFPVSILLFTFVMNLFDLFFLIPAYINLFSGLTYLGERLDGDFLLGRRIFVPKPEPKTNNEKKLYEFRKKESRRKTKCERSLSNVEKIRRATLVFVVFKSVTPVLPEFTSLLNYEYSNSMVNYYDFIPVYRIFAVFILFVVGIVWLSRSVKFYSGLKKDKVFLEALKNKYSEEVLPNRVYFFKKFAKKARIILSAAAFFMLNLYFDDVNVIPNIVAAALIVFGAIYIRKYTNKWTFAFISGILFGASSLITEILRYRFNADYIKEQIMKNPDAYSAWKNMFYSSVAEGTFGVLCVIAFALIAWDITKKYCGYFSKGTDSFDPVRATKELHSELLRPFIIICIFGICSSVCVPLYVYSLSVRFEAVWFLDLVFSLLFAGFLSYNFSEITRNINYNYFLGDE